MKQNQKIIAPRTEVLEAMRNLVNRKKAVRSATLELNRKARERGYR